MAIVCQCERVRERTIVKAIRAGASDPEAIGRSCGAATRCGGCLPTVIELIDAHGPVPVTTSPCPPPVIAIAS